MSECDDLPENILRHRLPPGKPVHLSDLPTRGREFHDDREAARAEFDELRDELAGLQHRLYAENRRKLLIVLQAMDAGGKDGTIRHVFRGVNPQGVHVTSFKKPTEEESSRDFLWRVHRVVPVSGSIAVFNRSHYEDVLVPRVEQLVPETIWRSRYQQINDFERLLTESGTQILKFYLHLSRDEQKKRLQARLENPAKHWKFSPEDVTKRNHWHQYVPAYEEALAVCGTTTAPWYAIPADQKWYRNLAVIRVIVETLRRMNPQFPPASIDPDQFELD